MSLIPLRYILIVIILWLTTGLAVGYVHKNPDGTKCIRGKHLNWGQWHTFFSIGSWELRYKPWNWDCDADEKYRAEDGFKEWTGERYK